MLVEEKLCKWLTAGLDLYRQNPLMIESTFFDQSQTGFPSGMAPGIFQDSEKAWIPGEYTMGILRWGGEEFPILGNTLNTLTLTGDPSLALNLDIPFYQIVPPSAIALTQLLQNEKFTVLSSFAQVPTQMPSFTLRLEKDEQAETSLGETLEHYASEGIEFDIRSQALTGNYLISIWTTNRESVLWLYAWLHNYALNSMTQFATWGLYNVSLSGSDLDPQLQYLAERVYTRHLLFTATRMERAVSLRPVAWVSDVCIKVLAHYARFQLTVPAME